MYMRKEQHSKAIQEAYRVLIKGVNLYIWDTSINEVNPFLVQLYMETNGLTF